jgi:hypothetical protein
MTDAGLFAAAKELGEWIYYGCLVAGLLRAVFNK